MKTVNGMREMHGLGISVNVTIRLVLSFMLALLAVCPISYYPTIQSSNCSTVSLHDHWSSPYLARCHPLQQV